MYKRRGSILNSSLGRSGEYLTCFYLEQFDCKPTITRSDGFDIIAEYNQKIIRIEVKSCSQSNIRRTDFQFSTVRGGNRRLLTVEDCDIVALVCIPFMHVEFIHISQVNKTRIRRKRSHFFSNGLEERTWVKSINRME
mgnify:CR=1 FL=1